MIIPLLQFNLQLNYVVSKYFAYGKNGLCVSITNYVKRFSKLLKKSYKKAKTSNVILHETLF